MNETIFNLPDDTCILQLATQESGYVATNNYQVPIILDESQVPKENRHYFDSTAHVAYDAVDMGTSSPRILCPAFPILSTAAEKFDTGYSSYYELENQNINVNSDLAKWIVVLNSSQVIKEGMNAADIADQKNGTFYQVVMQPFSTALRALRFRVLQKDVGNPTEKHVGEKKIQVACQKMSEIMDSQTKQHFTPYATVDEVDKYKENVAGYVFARHVNAAYRPNLLRLNVSNDQVPLLGLMSNISLYSYLYPAEMDELQTVYSKLKQSLIGDDDVPKHIMEYFETYLKSYWATKEVPGVQGTEVERQFAESYTKNVEFKMIIDDAWRTRKQFTQEEKEKLHELSKSQSDTHSLFQYSDVIGNPDATDMRSFIEFGCMGFIKMDVNSDTNATFEITKLTQEYRPASSRHPGTSFGHMTHARMDWTPMSAARAPASFVSAGARYDGRDYSHGVMLTKGDHAIRTHPMSARLHSMLNQSGSEHATPIHKLANFTIMLRPVTRQTFEWFLDNDIPPPCTFLLMAPFRKYVFGSAIAAKGGLELGASLYGKPLFEWGDSPISMTHVGHFSMYHQAVVKNKDRLCVVRNAVVLGYEGGENTRFYESPKQLNKHEGCCDTEDLSLFSYMTPATLRRGDLPNPLDVTGFWHSNFQTGWRTSAVTIDAHRPLFPSAHYYNHVWDWHELRSQYNSVSIEGRFTNERLINTTCWETMYWVTNATTGETCHTISTDAMGRNVYPGVQDLRRGTPGIFKEQGYERTYKPF